MLYRTICCMVVFLMFSCQTPPAPKEIAKPSVEFLTSENAVYPFSEAVRVGDLLILSGQIGTDPATGKLVEGGVEAETRQTMENIRNVLEKYGSSMNSVVKCTVMMEDMAEWPKMNEVYAGYFPDHFPARSAFGADGLALGARLEIEAWAVME